MYCLRSSFVEFSISGGRIFLLLLSRSDKNLPHVFRQTGCPSSRIPPEVRLSARILRVDNSSFSYSSARTVSRTQRNSIPAFLEAHCHSSWFCADTDRYTKSTAMKAVTTQRPGDSGHLISCPRYSAFLLFFSFSTYFLYGTGRMPSVNRYFSSRRPVPPASDSLREHLSSLCETVYGARKPPLPYPGDKY